MMRTTFFAKTSFPIKTFNFFTAVCIALLCGWLALLPSCKPEDLNPNAPLSFSQDTVRFDTVFVARGSATRYFKIKNTRSTAMTVNEIRLGGGQNSQYRINIDGTPTLLARDLEIAPHDSMWVFVQVNIDPNNTNTPFIVTDSVVTVMNGVEQRVILEAFGQNANYVGSKARAAVISCGNGTSVWDSPKPYVIYGWLFVDSCTWVIKPGTRIYVHGGIINKNGIFPKKEDYPYFDGLIYVTGKANILAEGTLAKPILFTGDRLEHDKIPTLTSLDYTQYTSQWTGIFLAANSKNNKFSYCNIKSAGFGINADSLTTLALKNCVINNHSAYALAARHAESVTAENCLFFSSDNYLLRLTYGGNYTFTHCTMACYGSVPAITHKDKAVLALSNSFCKKEDAAGNCIETLYHDLNATFTNCIIHGSLADEVKLAKATQAPFNVTFTNCMIKRTKESLNEATLTNCLTLASDTPDFKDLNKWDYHLKPESKAAGKATTSALTSDLEDKPRKNPSAIGCYELQ
jgi:hypothetical protein